MSGVRSWRLKSYTGPIGSAGADLYTVAANRTVVLREWYITNTSGVAQGVFLFVTCADSDPIYHIGGATNIGPVSVTPFTERFVILKAGDKVSFGASPPLTGAVEFALFGYVLVGNPIP